MEDGAIAHICLANKVKFAVIRIISDGEGQTMDYQQFSKIAAEKSVNIMKNFLKNEEV